DPGQAEDAGRGAVERLDLDVADAAELPFAVRRHLEDADGGAARDAQLLMAAPHDAVHRKLGVGADDLDRGRGGDPGVVAMAEAVDNRGQEGAVALFDYEAVATDVQAPERPAEASELHRSPLNKQDTVVPRPGAVSSWNSSTSFFTATRPLPMPRCDL